MKSMPLTCSNHLVGSLEKVHTKVLVLDWPPSKKSLIGIMA